MIVVTGTPGVGKHTVARLLAGRMGLGVVDLNALAAGAGLVEAGEVDTARLGEELGRAAPGRCVVVGHLAPHVAGGAEAAVVLRRSPYELVPVYMARGYPEAKCMENAASEILGVVAHEALGRYGERARQVDATGQAPGAVADEAAACVAGGRGADVDWLGMVAGRGDLGRFFGY